MTIHNISPDSVAMFIAGEELRQEGLDVESLDVGSAAKLARAAFKKAGIDVEGRLEIESFAGDCGILVFARLSKSLPVVYRFENFEDMLGGAEALCESVRGNLYAMDGLWFAEVTGGWESSHVLSEFGAKLTDADPGGTLGERGVRFWDGASLRGFAGQFQ